MPADTDPADGTSTSDRHSDAEDALNSEVVRYDGEPDRRTLYPAAADENQLLTHWITANEGSFVDLRDLR
jgi:hypothetical protein